MRVANKTIDEVIKEVAGEDVVPLVNLIKKKKNISEFKIAEMMEINVNVVRNMLYRLYHKNLVSFVRKKDKKKGWYIYYWTFNMKRVSSLLDDIKKEKIEKLTERLEREKNNFFFTCSNGCMRLDFEKAMDYGFKCPECGELMQQEDNVAKIADIEKEIKELEETLKKPVEKKEDTKKTEKPSVEKVVKKKVAKKIVKKVAVKKNTAVKAVKKKTQSNQKAAKTPKSPKKKEEVNVQDSKKVEKGIKNVVGKLVRSVSKRKK